MVMTCIKALTEVKMKVKDDVFRELTGMLSERKNLSLYESVPLDEGSYNLSESSYREDVVFCFIKEANSSKCWNNWQTRL